MQPPNTLNICLGHLPPPAALATHADLMIAPLWMPAQRRLAVVEDASFGAAGDTLSEYAQLIWLSDHLHEIADGFEFIRIFHYRRFTCREQPAAGAQAANQPWSRTVTDGDLPRFDAEFSRRQDAELFNTPVDLGGMLPQYAAVHVLEDLLHFAGFLLARGILSSAEACEFLQGGTLIPACNIGVFRLRTQRMLFRVLKAAAGFIDSAHFVRRDGYQRRNGGFLLERLHSFLILKAISSGLCQPRFGHNMVLSQDSVVSLTS